MKKDIFLVGPVVFRKDENESLDFFIDKIFQDTDFIEKRPNDLWLHDKTKMKLKLLNSLENNLNIGFVVGEIDENKVRRIET